MAHHRDINDGEWKPDPEDNSKVCGYYTTEAFRILPQNHVLICYLKLILQQYINSE